MNVLSLFAGIGGLDLGLERAGMTVVGQVELDPFCCSVLAKHWPEVPRHDDVRTAVSWWLGTARPPVDLVCGGFPCQPESLAGKRGGTEDARWLWPDMARIIHAVRPVHIIGENVMGHRTRGLRFVLRDLERLGYAARAGVVGAGEMGAPHRRQRIFILAHAGGQGLEGPRQLHDPDQAEGTGPFAADGGWWAAEPDVGRVAHGVPNRVDRLRAIGNAVVPQVAEFVGRLILEGVAA
jgi:DNA (cytosine-5)-methyltransferase 1